jgi:hypothetical protein
VKTDELGEDARGGRRAGRPSANHAPLSPRARNWHADRRGLHGGILRLNPALSHYLSEPMFWIREAYCLALSAIALLGVHRLARPGRRLGLVPAALALVVIAMWVLAVVALAPASPQTRTRLLFGATAAVCPFLIALIAAPSIHRASVDHARSCADTTCAGGSCRGIRRRIDGCARVFLALSRARGAVHRDLVSLRYADSDDAGRVARTAAAALVGAEHQ